MQKIRAGLQLYQPRLITSAPTHGQAAVALLVRDGAAGIEVLLIQRAAHPRDPWSGNLGFPGGRIDAADSGLLATAIRETAEEVGIHLQPRQQLGRLDDQHGVRVPVQVSCFVFMVSAGQPIRINPEVQRTLWYPVAQLRQPQRHARRSIDWHGRPFEVPSLYIEDHIPLLWGLTYRFVDHFLSVVGMPLPPLVAADGD